MKRAHTASMRTKAKSKLWSLEFALILIIMLSCSISIQAMNTGTTVYVGRVGGPSMLAGILAAVFSLSAALSRLVFGPIIDKRGRAVIMRLGAGIVLVGTILPGLLHADLSLFLARFLQGVGFAAASTAASTAAADVLPSERLGEGIGYYGLAQAISTAIGPGFALFLVATDPAENLFFVISGVCVFTLILTIQCRYEKNYEKLSESSTYYRRMVKGDVEDSDANNKQYGLRKFFESCALPGAIPQTILSASFGFSIFFAGIYGTSLGVENTGLFFTFAAVSMIASRLRSRYFMDTLLSISSFTFAAGMGFLCCVFLLFTPLCTPLYYLAGVCYGFGVGISLPLNQSIAVKNTPPQRWGAANATFLLSNDVGFGIACVMWGAINDGFGYSATIVCTIICTCIAYVSAWIVYPKNAKTKIK